MIRLGLVLFAVSAGLPGLGAASMPAYVREALARFHTDPPQGWAYTLAVTRNGEQSVQHFDPGKPAGQQWTLVAQNGRPPTAQETARYLQEKSRNSAPPARAAFNKEAIDRTAFELVREDPQRAVVRFRFIEDSADKMLNHLVLELIVARQPPAIEQYTLRLVAPFSPVLTVKMLELEAGTTFGPAGSPLAGLPVRTTSRFKGRIFFKSIEEILTITYADYVQAQP